MRKIVVNHICDEGFVSICLSRYQSLSSVSTSYFCSKSYGLTETWSHWGEQCVLLSLLLQMLTSLKNSHPGKPRIFIHSSWHTSLNIIDIALGDIFLKKKETNYVAPKGIK
jgi:hypothetical protein